MSATPDGAANPAPRTNSSLPDDNEARAQATREAHMAIPYPETRADFGQAAAVFDGDALTIAGHPVMQGFQDGYMQALADIAGSNGGDVLEIGYGMGLAARHFAAQPNIRTRTVIECHPDVIARCLANFRSDLAAGTLRIIAAYWEDAVGMLADESFDGILFDTYPTTRDDVELSHFPFFPHAHRLLRPGGVLTYYGDEPIELPPEHLAKLAAAGFTDVTQTVVALPRQDNPLYWQADTMVAPAARKT